LVFGRLATGLLALGARPRRCRGFVCRRSAVLRLLRLLLGCLATGWGRVVMDQWEF